MCDSRRPLAGGLFPAIFNFKLAVGESLNQPFEVTLPLDAVTGKQDLRLDFDLMADHATSSMSIAR